MHKSHLLFCRQPNDHLVQRNSSQTTSTLTGEGLPTLSERALWLDKRGEATPTSWLKCRAVAGASGGLSCSSV
jgi:hypothetical protein